MNIKTTQRRLMMALIIWAIILQCSERAKAFELPTSFQGVADLHLKFPFSSGSEWQTTGGWEAANHQQNWNWFAVDFVPVGRSCLGEAVLAAAHGWIASNDGHGIQIDHRINNYRSLYAHLDTTDSSLVVGTEVFQGQKIGTCGGYPNYVPHIHFQIYQGKWSAGGGEIPIPINGVEDANLLKSYKRGLFSSNDGNKTPNVPLPLAPTNNSLLTDYSVTMGWQDNGDPDNGPNPFRNYSAWLWKADNSWTLPLEWQNTPATSWTATVPSSGEYCWKVQAGDGRVGSGFTDPWCFTVGHVVNLPLIRK